MRSVFDYLVKGNGNGTITWHEGNSVHAFDRGGVIRFLRLKFWAHFSSDSLDENSAPKGIEHSPHLSKSLNN